MLAVPTNLNSIYLRLVAWLSTYSSPGPYRILSNRQVDLLRPDDVLLGCKPFLSHRFDCWSPSCLSLRLKPHTEQGRPISFKLAQYLHSVTFGISRFCWNLLASISTRLRGQGGVADQLEVPTKHDFEYKQASSDPPPCQINAEHVALLEAPGNNTSAAKPRGMQDNPHKV